MRAARATGLALLLSAGRLDAQGQPLPGLEWAQFHAGDQVELDAMCTGNWRPVTVTKVEADGARGTYRYDAAARQLLFLTGPKKGSRAQQESDVTFQILDAKGNPTGNYCPHNPGRNPNGVRL